MALLLPTGFAARGIGYLDVDGCTGPIGGSPSPETAGALYRLKTLGFAAGTVTGKDAAYIEQNRSQIQMPDGSEAFDSFRITEFGGRVWLPAGERFFPVNGQVGKVRSRYEQDVTQGAAPAGTFVEGDKRTIFTIGHAYDWEKAREVEGYLKQVVGELALPFGVTAHPTGVDAIPEGLDKVWGMRVVANAYDIPFDCSFAFGDMPSDLPMMEAVPVAGCPENADEWVKEFVRGREADGRGYVGKGDFGAGLADFAEWLDASLQHGTLRLG